MTQTYIIRVLHGLPVASGDLIDATRLGTFCATLLPLYIFPGLSLVRFGEGVAGMTFTPPSSATLFKDTGVEMTKVEPLVSEVRWVIGT